MFGARFPGVTGTVTLPGVCPAPGATERNDPLAAAVKLAVAVANIDKLVEVAEEARVVEGIRKGLEDMRAGRPQPVEAAFDDIRRSLDLPRKR